MCERNGMDSARKYTSIVNRFIISCISDKKGKFTVCLFFRAKNKNDSGESSIIWGEFSRSFLKFSRKKTHTVTLKKYKKSKTQQKYLAWVIFWESHSKVIVFFEQKLFQIIFLYHFWIASSMIELINRLCVSVS